MGKSIDKNRANRIATISDSIIIGSLHTITILSFSGLSPHPAPSITRQNLVKISKKNNDFDEFCQKMIIFALKIHQLC